MNLLKQIKKIAAVAASSAIVIGSLMPSWQINALDNTVNTKKAENIAADVTTDTSAFDLSTAVYDGDKTYITGAVIKYKTQGGNWTDVSTSANVPADADLQITVTYAGVPSSIIKNNYNRTLVYSLPELMIDPVVSSDTILNENNQSIGTITADTADKMIKMTFVDSHLAESTISGSFTFTARADKSKITSPVTSVKIGDQEIKIDFEDHPDARLGELSVKKSDPVFIPIANNNKKGYLEYQVTVTAGNTDMPDVVVADMLSDDTSWLLADSNTPYNGLNLNTEMTLSDSSSDGEPYEKLDTVSSGHGTVTYTDADLPDSSKAKHAWLKWNIGSMKANESRTLTYRVILNENAVGLSNKSSVKNTAVPYSMSYKHTGDSSTFVPKTSVTVSKSVGDVVINENNTITIPYTINVTVPNDSTWVLRNLKLNDMVGRPDLKGDIGTISNQDLIKYSAKLDNFRVDGKTDGFSVNVYNTGATYSPSFDMYFGDVYPGETKKITYDLTLNKDILTTSSGVLSILNSAFFYSDDSKAGDKTVGKFYNQYLGYAPVVKTVQNKQWTRKLAGDKLKSDSTLSMRDIPVYEYDSQANSWVKSESAPSSYVVPSGSYKYQVVVNEKGDWDVSSATMHDAFSNQYLQYKGYLKLDYYDKGVNTDSGNAQNAVTQLQKLTPKKSVWLKVDGLSEFSIITSSISSDFKQGAYLLTYYAAGNNLQEITQTKTDNSFTLSGNLYGPVGDHYAAVPTKMNGIIVKASVVVDGDINYQAKKSGWYFDSKKDSPDYSSGSLYWVIDVSGEKVPAGTELIDGTDENSLIRGSSLVGIYVGSMPGQKNFTDQYSSIDDVTSDLQSKQNLTPLTTDDYEIIKTGKADDNRNLVIRLKQDITMQDNQHMYIVVRTAANSKAVSSNKAQKLVFTNSLYIQDAGQTLKYLKNTASIITAAGGSNYKQGIAVMAKDQTGWHNLSEKGTYQSASWPVSSRGVDRIIKDNSLPNGTYLDWHIKINYGANQEGTVTVRDTLPDGVEPVYVRYFWAKGKGLDITMPEITDDRINEQDWKDIGLKNTNIDASTTIKRDAHAYYNASTHEILFDAANLQKASQFSSDTADAYSLEVQILVHVTDPGFNNSQVSSKTFKNTMTISQGDKIITNDEASLTAAAPKIAKSMHKESGNKVSFTLTVNPYGSDLVKGSDSITLIDEMDGTLDFDPDSIVVREGDTSGKILTNVTASISDILYSSGNATGKHKLLLVLPDSKKLTIQYTGIITIKPGENVSLHVVNKAYWLGFSTDTPQIDDSSIKYNTSAISWSNKEPSIRIVKYDKNQISKKLAGATFSIQKAVYNPDKQKWEADSSEGTFEAVTGDGNNGSTLGELIFSSDSDKNTTKPNFMQFNTVYMIQETKAPDRYQSDNTIYYVEIARLDTNTRTYDDRSEDEQKGVTVYYGGTLYTQNVYNKKGSLLVTKNFKDIMGNDVTGTDIPDGTYSFGLYDHASPSSTDKPLQTLDIVSQSGNYSYYLTYAGWNLTKAREDQPLFVDLAVGAKFYVYELDVNGHAVKQYDSRNLTSSFTAQNGLSYEARYSNATNEVVIPDTGNGEVTVTNQRHFEYEPVTGVRLTDDKLLSWALVLVVGILLTGLLKRMGKDM